MMANRIQLEIGGFEELIAELDEIGGNINETVTTVLEDAGEDVGVRTIEAMKDVHLPAGGDFSRPETIDTVIKNPKAEWEGPSFASIGVGFDKSKNGVGTLLITGTPRMRPDYELEKIYVQKKYMKQLNKQISEYVQEMINETLEG